MSSSNSDHAFFLLKLDIWIRSLAWNQNINMWWDLWTKENLRGLSVLNVSSAESAVSHSIQVKYSKQINDHLGSLKLSTLCICFQVYTSIIILSPNATQRFSSILDRMIYSSSENKRKNSKQIHTVHICRRLEAGPANDQRVTSQRPCSQIIGKQSRGLYANIHSNPSTSGCIINYT